MPPPVATPRRLRRLLRLLALASALGFALATTVSGFGHFNWAAELTTHFRVQAVIAGALIAIACAILRLRAPAIGTCAFIACQLYPVLPFLLPAELAGLAELPTPSGTPQVRLMQINVHRKNRNHQAVEQAIRAANPDIIGLVEVNQRWLRALAPLHARYPYRIEHPREDSFGIALFSRFPIDELQLRPLGEQGVQMITGNFSLAGKRVTVAVAHPVSPVGSSYAARRNRQLVRLSEILRKLEGREIILLGDLNTSPWSPIYRQFERSAGLRNGALGFGLKPTWPTSLPLLMIPLDHCLLSPGLRVTSFEVGPRVGSDHLPVLVEIAPLQARLGETIARLNWPDPGRESWLAPR